MGNYWGLIVFVGAIVCGAYMVISSLREIIPGINSDSWPDTQGVVTLASITEGSNGDGDIIFAPKISYSYMVKGVSYQGKQVNYGTLSGANMDAQAVLSRFPLGQVITVYYHPHRPAMSVLIPGLHPGPGGLGDYVITIGFGLLCVCGGLFALYMNFSSP